MIEAVSLFCPPLDIFSVSSIPFLSLPLPCFYCAVFLFLSSNDCGGVAPTNFWLQCLGRAGHAPREVGRYIVKSLHLSWTVRWPPKVVRHTQLPIRPSHYYGPLIWSKYGPSNPPFLMTKSVISGWSSGSFAYCKFLNFTDSFHTVLCSAWALPLYNV